MSVHVACSMIPSSMRFSVKYPVPEPISSAWAKGVDGMVPSAFSSFIRTCERPVSAKSMPHFAS